MRKMFSKKQLIEIVSQAMSSGLIASGTKLYKHIVNLDGSLGDDYFSFIDNNKEAITSSTSFIDLVSRLQNAILLMFAFESFGTGLHKWVSLTYDTGNNLIEFYGIEGGAVVGGSPDGDTISSPLSQYEILDSVSEL